MSQSITTPLRLEIVKTRQEEKLSYRAIADRYKVSYNTVRTICQTYEERGASALVPDYSNCGRIVDATAEKAYRLVRLVSHFHSHWGVPYILTRIEVDFPDLPLQSIRHYQRRLKAQRPVDKIPPPTIPREDIVNDVRQPHDEWQIDAKEQIKLASGKEVCYLNITDTKTHALLKAKTFPPRIDPSDFFETS